METDETKIFKYVKDSIIKEEIVNEDFEKVSNSMKSLDEALDVVSNMEKKLLEVRNPTCYGLRTNKVKSLKNSKRMKIL